MGTPPVLSVSAASYASSGNLLVSKAIINEDSLVALTPEALEALGVETGAELQFDIVCLEPISMSLVRRASLL
jgi:hypothetical protein